MPDGTGDDDVAAMVARFGAQLTEPTRPFALLVRFQAQAGGEPAVMAFDLNREASDPARFVVYERWRSLAEFAAHLRTPYVAKLRHELEAMMTGAPEFHVLRPAAEREGR
jgi:quinol monooxygenase YgiN